MPTATLAFWIDVDNTLLNNDGVKESQDAFLRTALGPDLAGRFWELYEQVRVEREVVDIPLALSRFRKQVPLAQIDAQTYEHVHSMFDNYPFPQALYPYTLETLQYLRTLGLTVIVSDGDQYFQAEKIFGSNLADAVDGRVLLYSHKQRHLDEIMQRYPADHYVMVDDKPQILADSQPLLGDKLTTVFVKQGKYAAAKLPENFTPAITVERIGDLRGFPVERFFSQR